GSSENSLHLGFGNLVPQRRRAVVHSERVVDRRDKMEAVAYHGDDFAVARVADIGDRMTVAVDHSGKSRRPSRHANRQRYADEQTHVIPPSETRLVSRELLPHACAAALSLSDA